MKPDAWPVHRRLEPFVGDLPFTGDDPYISPVLDPGIAFDELLPSWNVAVPAGAGFVPSVRVASDASGAEWSDWFPVGRFGAAGLEAISRRPDPAAGRVEVDLFRAASPKRLAQIRFLGMGESEADCRLIRLNACFTRLKGGCRDTMSGAITARRLEVPFRSQRWLPAPLRDRACSPTSVAMVLEYHGVCRDTTEVAARSFDLEHDLYGNWSRAVQVAFDLGLAGRLDRLSSWPEVEAQFLKGRPLIISVRAGEGELTGAPYRSTAGHLLVLCGFDRDRNVLVNDPAAESEARGRLVYRRREIERVWMARGGTTYVLGI